MCILVRGYCVYLSRGQACFVNAYMRTNVLRKDEPFVCMVQFLPSAESADMVLVGTAEFVAIYMVVLFKLTGRYRERLQTLLLKNQPTRLSSGWTPE